MRFAAFALMSLLAGVLTSASASAQAPAARPTLAVVPFETGRTGWAPPPEFGATLAELLGDRLIESGKFRVMDYTWLTEASAGHGRPALDVLSRRAVEAGVDYLVLGSVTRYSTEHRRRRVGVAGFVPFIGGGGKTSVESVMGLTIRVIDARTGEIVTTATPEGSASRRNVSLGGLALGLGARSAALGAGGALLSSSASGSREALVDEAMHDAIDLAADALVNAVAKLIGTAFPRASGDRAIR